MDDFGPQELKTEYPHTASGCMLDGRGRLRCNPHLDSTGRRRRPMKLCPHCSSSLEDDAVKCRRCGKWVVEKRARPPAKKNKGSFRKRLIILGALGILAWAVWNMPEGYRDPRELLDLKPSRETVLQTLRSDLEELVRLEGEFYRTEGSYSGTPSALGFTASEGVNLSLIATPTGWSGAATHEDHPPEAGCAVFGGSGRPPQAPIRPTEPEVVECTGGVL